MSKLLKYCILFVIVSLVQCKEIYKPEIEKRSKVLVVEALITDEPVAQLIKLSNAVPYDTSYFVPETGATVVVVDQANQYKFRPTQAGYYYSDPKQFKPTSGKSYRLTITTTDKRKYITDYQMMAPKVKFDSVYWNLESKSYYRQVGNEYTFFEFPGVQLYTKFNSGNSSYYRFSSSLVVQYTYFDTTDSSNYACWMKKIPDDFFNLVDTKYNTSTSRQQKLCYFPINKSYFGISDIYVDSATTFITYIHSFILTIKQYQMNKDAFTFYQNVNEQLQAQNKLFDPINSHFKGNIICQNDPEKLVLGLFDLSSVSTTSYKIIATPGSNRINIKKLASFDFDKVPSPDCSKNIKPGFWVD